MRAPNTEYSPSAVSLWLVGLLFGLALLLGPAGRMTQPLQQWWSPGPVHLESVTVEVNGRPRTLLAGQALLVRPDDRVRMVKVNLGRRQETSDFSLKGSGFEAPPLKAGVAISEIIPPSPKPQAYPLAIQRGEATLGQVSLVSVVLPVDWIIMAQKAKGPERLELLKTALTLAPGNAILLEGLYRTCLEQGWLEPAAEALQAKLEVAMSVGELAALAELYQKLGRTAQLAGVLNQLSKLEPEKEIWAERLLSLADQADPTLKVQTLQQLIQRATGPNAAAAAKKLGYAHVQAGRWAEAAKAYENAAKLDPKDANIYHNLAVIYDKLGQPDKRRKTLLTLSELRPQDLDVLKELARSAPGNEAVAAWEKVLAARADDEEAIVSLIKLIQPYGPSPRLVELYARLARLKPGDAVVWYNLGLTQTGAKQFAEAGQSLQKAHELSPQDLDVLLALLEVQRQQKEILAASATIEKILALKPGQIDLYEQLYDWLSRVKQFDRLEKNLLQGLETQPNSMDLWKMLLTLRLERKNTPGAIETLKKMAALDPDNVDLRLRLAKLLEGQGQLKAAFDVYAEILQKQPENQAASQAYMRLRLELLKQKVSQ